MANERIQFQEEHRQLLKVQVLTHDALQKLAEAQTELAAAQAHTDERMAALIGTVDELIRRPPLQ